jgi:pyruvate dehydrogenase E2 component (dihydrolipoamide acetyltransferase)
MPIKILMPALSPTMTEGNLAKWLKSEGDQIKSGDVIAEIETDKATMEVEAVDEGTLGKILVPDGTEGVKVNEPIALLLEEGEDRSALEGGAAPPPAKGNGEAEPPASSAPAAAAQPPTVPPPTAAQGDRIVASPLARRMAAQAGLDLAAIRGSGPHGRVIKADIEAALAGARPAQRPMERAAPFTAPAAAPPVSAPAAPPPSAAYDEIPLNNMRKVIARRLTEAKQTIPHFYLTLDCELDALLAMRAQLNAREGADYKLSVNDFVIKAVALAMRKVPGVNAAWGGDKIYQFKDIDVSVAVAIDGGLITPIVRKADQKGLSTISNEMKDLAKRAKDGKLKPEEFQGGGFSISNLGMFGIKDFLAVINPPQACILSVGAGEKRPVVRGDEIKIATMMSVGLSTDHRVVDGVLGAQFLQEFKKLMEDPLALLL